VTAADFFSSDTSIIEASMTEVYMTLDALPVIVVGGGPVGLAAAAHLLERGLEPLVLEAGDRPGASVAEWGHVRMFSPWAFNVDGAAGRLLRRRGWAPPAPGLHPTGAELLQHYLTPLAETPEIAPRLRVGARVVGVARQRLGKVRDGDRDTTPFAVRVRRPDGGELMLAARAVIDTSGTWGTPAPAGADGLPAIGERDPAAAAGIRYGMPDLLDRDRGQFAGRRVAVLGAGHSAIGSLIDLVELARVATGTEVVWLTRRTDLSTVYGGGDRDALAERGALGERLRRLVADGTVDVRHDFYLESLRANGDMLRIGGMSAGTGTTLDVDRLIVATGFRPDLSFLSEIRLDLDPALECPRALAPLIDPNLHSCGTVQPHGAVELAQPEPGFFFAGMKSYGRAPTFLLATGHEQVRSIAARLAGDEAAARRVELALPETGVCTTGDPAVAIPDAGCCGGPAPVATAACCIADTAAQTEGGTR